MTDLVERLWTLVRHGRDQGMKMNDVEDAAREIERLRAEVKYRISQVNSLDAERMRLGSELWAIKHMAVEEAAPMDPRAWDGLLKRPEDR